ncbi:Uncharacterized protein APZ42_011702 [Daphnia magna]|uniref:Uncharacterized protein n=1 Tax=Daphnia magna TaxID=35525 RepID=A0A162SXR1_9CRUS|nr:Uncharacterized protein APZ42_011702 [Daphnia magna]
MTTPVHLMANPPSTMRYIFMSSISQGQSEITIAFDAWAFKFEPKNSLQSSVK